MSLVEVPLHSQEDLFEALFQHALDAVLVANNDGYYVEINPAACDLIGRVREDIIGHHIDEFFELQHGTSVVDAWQSFRQERTQFGVVRVKRPDGALRYAGFRATADFRPGLHVSVLRDITAERQTAQELERKNSELSRVNAELSRSNSELTHFAYAVGHDLKAPLRTIASFAQLLRRRVPDDAEAVEYLTLITGAARQMQGFLDDLLNYSQANPATGPLPVFPLEMSLEWALANLTASIADTGAEITHEALPSLSADQSQMARLFQNLIGNALKYRGTERPRIHISASRQGEEWVISVADNGIGIAPEYHQTIFGIFKRLHGAEHPGTGLGLALCKRIVENHGGRIWVESQPGQGSTFRFTLPAGA